MEKIRLRHICIALTLVRMLCYAQLAHAQEYYPPAGSGSVAASNVTAGTFGAGDYAFQGNVDVPNTTFASTKGVVTKASTRFLHNFNYGNNGSVTTEGFNTFLGEGAGNFTMGATATLTTDASANTGIGYHVLQNVTVGHRNTCVGYLTCSTLTSPNYNMAFGNSALRDVSTGTQNNAFGYLSGSVISTGQDNAMFGHSAGSFVVTGSRNTFVGSESDGAETNSSDRVGLGYRAGKFTTGDADRCKAGNFNMYIGVQSRCSTNGASTLTHEYVFGGTVSGSGSYTMTFGNTKSAIQLSMGDAATCATNCGTSPTLTGNNSSFTLTMGATGSPASGFVVTFDTDGAFTAAPQCVGSMALAGMVVGKLPLTLVTTTTTLTVVTNGTAPANGDKYHFICTLGK